MDWKSIQTKENKETFQACVNQTVKYIRIINKTKETVEARIGQFIVVVK